MVRCVYAAWDEKAGVYLTPFFCVRQEVAIRSFAAALSKPELEMALFPKDFSLFELGEFDDETGLIVAHAAPKLVITGVVLAAQLAKKGD